MATTEHTINDALAALLRETRHAWRGEGVVNSENTRSIESSSARPDILVLEPDVSPIVLETEVAPAATVEDDALSRLGKYTRDSRRRILSSIAVRLPARLRKMSGVRLDDELRRCIDLEFAVLTGPERDTASRWPTSGWLIGSTEDLSLITQAASVPPLVIEEAANRLAEGVSQAAALLTELADRHPGALSRIAEELRQKDGVQTRRMAATILANACVFQENLAGGPGELRHVKSLEELRDDSGTLSRSVVLNEWRKVLKVNYWPIFDIARRILETIPTSASPQIIELMASTAERLIEKSLMRSHDLTGRLFQKLIADRKFLAAFYTTPSAASLLVGLAITPTQPLAGAQWGIADSVADLRIADFACGTGTLLSTAYQRIGQLHELAGGNSEHLHSGLMANCLIGCDVMPSAAHLTASMLAGAHPTVKYETSRVMAVAYGAQADGSIALGSLDLLEPYRSFDTLGITSRRAEASGEAETETSDAIGHESCNVVLMNPPFTRATGHEADKVGVPVPMFAAFNISDNDQRQMSRAITRLTRNSAAHGNAGEASIFLVLGHRKLKPGGVIGLVMPVSLMSGVAWSRARQLLTTQYDELTVVSISGGRGQELSFSADTDIGECLVVAVKATPERRRSNRATFVVLKDRPQSQIVGEVAAAEIVRAIRTGTMRQLEDGPVGGTALRFGDEVIGHAMQAPVSSDDPWNLARIADLSIAQVAYQLASEGRAWLPRMTSAEAAEIPITNVSNIGHIGPYHMDINAEGSRGTIRGPFTIQQLNKGSSPTYPVLWGHSAAEQRTLRFGPDSEAVVRLGRSPTETRLIEEKAKSIWASASHCHFNRDFRFNSQSTSMQFTPKKAIGGRAWPSIHLASQALEKLLVLWSNTTLGMLLYWWHANKQQAGRGSIGVLALQSLPILDVSKLSTDQSAEGTEVFDSLCSEPLKRFSEIDNDPARVCLDTQFLGSVLGLHQEILAPGGPLALVRQKLASEASIRG